MDDFRLIPDVGQEAVIELNDYDDHLLRVYEYGEPTFVDEVYAVIVDYKQLDPICYKGGHRARLRVRRVE